MTKLVHIPKLIETSLPLEAINEACYYEKMPGIGPHPRGIHLWWARRPLASARAVIFASMVNDPLWKYGEHPTPQQKSAATKKREELKALIAEMVKWESTTNEKLFAKAHEEILESWREICEANGKLKIENGKWVVPPLPAFHDPFAGGGALPLEAQRLGLESHASDLNPVAVMINKAMIEIPPKFAGRTPIGPVPDGEVFLATKDAKNAENGRAVSPLTADKVGSRVPRDRDGSWPGATGLAEDVRRYGHWMREEAKKRIGHLYPQVEVTAAMAENRPDLKQYVGQKLTVIAWLWARTVKSPNPMFSNIDVPLVSSYVLSSKKGKEAWVEPVIDEVGSCVPRDRDGRAVAPRPPSPWHFEVRTGTPPRGAEDGNKHTLSRSSVAFDCILSKVPISGDYIKEAGTAGRMGARMMAVVCEGDRGRVYLSPTDEDIEVPEPAWLPPGRLPARRITGGTCVPYGLDEWHKLFTKRQLVALNTFSDLVQEAREKVIADCGDTEYANAVATYLAFAVDRAADFNSNICRWSTSNEKSMNTFARQSIPIVWDFAEVNVLEKGVGSILSIIEYQVECIKKVRGKIAGASFQADAQQQTISQDKVVSTDPPYYDNISYADLADFFYVWMRRSLKGIYPELFATMATPKEEELVATPYKHGGRENAEAFFMDGMTAAMRNLARQTHPAYPVTIYYAFKQGESNASGTGNTGWETFLEAVIQAGFAITGTWPMRSEQAYRMIGMGANALASSIVLVCRKRDEGGGAVATKREFLAELKRVMPGKLEAMTEGGAIAPVDLAQAAIGPGVEIYSKYDSILKQDGSHMSVHEALIEINRYLDGEDDNCDSQTRFLFKWFSDYGWSERDFGEADNLARAKGTSVATLVDSGAFASAKGRARLVHWKDYPSGYDPAADRNRPVWEALHHLVRALMTDGEKAAGGLLARMPEVAGGVRSLAYRLYVNCERRGMADDARAYNALVMSWSEIELAKEEAARSGRGKLVQGTLL